TLFVIAVTPFTRPASTTMIRPPFSRWSRIRPCSCLTLPVVWSRPDCFSNFPCICSDLSGKEIDEEPNAYNLGHPSGRVALRHRTLVRARSSQWLRDAEVWTDSRVAQRTDQTTRHRRS